MRIVYADSGTSDPPPSDGAGPTWIGTVAQCCAQRARRAARRP
ncbi:hypothetical protein [Nocardia terpenica]|nr:hypothetical protein [Nocardia terpenica]